MHANISDDMAEKMLAVADEDGSGTVSVEEFKVAIFDEKMRDNSAEEDEEEEETLVRACVACVRVRACVYVRAWVYVCGSECLAWWWWCGVCACVRASVCGTTFLRLRPCCVARNDDDDDDDDAGDER